MARIKYYNSSSNTWKFADIAGEDNVQSDWTQSDTSADDFIKNKPTFSPVATSGSYNDLSNKPNLATVALSGSYNDLVVKPTADATLSVSGGFADAKTTGDRVQAVMPPYVLSWNDLGAASSFGVGWRSGYIKDDGSVGTNNKYISTSTKIRNYASSEAYSHEFMGASKIGFDLPSGVTIIVKEWASTATSTLKNRWECESGDTIALTPNCLYGFNIGYESDATDKLTESYLSTIKVIVYPTTPKKYRSTEFERFAVKINRAWPDISSTASTNVEGSNIVTTRCMITLPESYTPTGDPTPVIMLSHGSGGAVYYNSWNSDSADFLALVRYFTAAGYAVFDVDNTRGTSSGHRDYGCLALCTAYLKAWERIKEMYNVKNDLYIYCYSMGTTAALNILKWHTTDVRAVVNAAPRPVCELTYNTAPSGGVIQTQMATSYGLSGTTWEHDRLKAFNHYENAVTIGNDEYIFEQFPPVKVLIGGADTSMYTEANAYYDALANAGNYVNKREVAGVNHDDMCFLVPGDLKAEVVAWFDRFDK